MESTSVADRPQSAPETSTTDAASTGQSEPERLTISGPLMRHPALTHPEDHLTALIRGVLEYEDGCLYLAATADGERYPVLWAASTEWDAQRRTVVLHNGDEIAVGQSVNGGGGYLSVDDIEEIAGQQAAELARRCVDNTYGDIAVVNNSDTSIGPG